MLSTVWGKASAFVQNKEPSYTKLDFKLSFSVLIIKIINFFLEKNSTVYCIMALLLLYKGLVYLYTSATSHLIPKRLMHLLSTPNFWLTIFFCNIPLLDFLNLGISFSLLLFPLWYNS